jgi:protein-S-isoprenylcysteine O-methyltransferase Ste14
MMVIKDSTAEAKVQGAQENLSNQPLNQPLNQPSNQHLSFGESALIRAAARMGRLSKQFGWPALLLMALGPSYLFELSPSQLPWLLLFGMGPLFGGLLLRVWCRGYLRAEGFVLDGPYRYVRNPVELGAVLCFIGASVFLGLHAWYILALAVLAIVYLSVVGVATDRVLVEKHGTVYLRYMHRVRRWIPNGLPGTNRSYRNYSLLMGLKHERESLIWLIGLFAVFALKKRFG